MKSITVTSVVPHNDCNVHYKTVVMVTQQPNQRWQQLEEWKDFIYKAT